jgi:hypothetical protein
MSSTFTPNKIYELQTTGENAGTWGTLLDAVLSIIDLNLGGRLALNVAGSADITLTSTQERNVYILCTGVLTGNISVVFTSTNGGFYLIDNRSTGTFTITAKYSGGTGVVVPQGGKSVIMIDPDNTRAVMCAQPYSTRTIKTIAVLSDGATPALDASLGDIFTLTTTTNPTIAVPTNPANGQTIIIAVTASGSNRTLSLNTGAGGFHFGSDVTGLSAIVSGKTDYIGAIYNSVTSFWNVVGYIKGF